MSFLGKVCEMYLTMSPLIAGGIANMIFTKTPLYKKYKSPMDFGKKCKDGRRVFGENKTWIGFFSMIVFCAIFQIMLGYISTWLNIDQYNDLYNIYENTLLLNTIFGVLVGFVYMISELPNSFIKRRLNIDAGKTDKGVKGFLFFIIDQIDSLVGVMLVLFLFSDFSFWKYLGYVAIGAFTHISVNLILYLTKVRKNI